MSGHTIEWRTKATNFQFIRSGSYAFLAGVVSIGTIGVYAVSTSIPSEIVNGGFLGGILTMVLALVFVPVAAALLNEIDDLEFRFRYTAPLVITGRPIENGPPRSVPAGRSSFLASGRVVG